MWTRAGGRSGRVRIGARRSPVRTPAAAAALARAALARGLAVDGLMAYEAQIAGVGDRPPGRPLYGAAVRAMQAASGRELAARRAAVVAAVRAVAPLRFVNGGGTGSVARTAADPSVTEIAAGSGLYGPTLFDAYRAWRPRPAAFFVLPVVRKPSAAEATVLGGGYVASGAPGRDRLPRPVHPPGLRLDRAEGAGEVQTPLLGPGAAGLAVGDRVWFRHAKAGELCERFDTLALVAGGRVVGRRADLPGRGPRVPLTGRRRLVAARSAGTGPRTRSAQRFVNTPPGSSSARAACHAAQPGWRGASPAAVEARCACPSAGARPSRRAAPPPRGTAPPTACPRRRGRRRTRCRGRGRARAARRRRPRSAARAGRRPDGARGWP